MNNISVDIRLRPIRFGFLVHPNDGKNLLEIFRANTCLWGGQYNPIIPIFDRVPSWWDRGRHDYTNAKQIINGYLDFFEPDFVVESEKDIAKGLGFDSERVLQFSDVLPFDDERQWNCYGLSVRDLYRDLYKTEFQLERRHKRNMIHVEVGDRQLTLFAACCFGSFPVSDELKYLERDYVDVFSPARMMLTASALPKLYERRYISPLGIGCAKCRVDYNAHREPTLFIMDAQQCRDLIDFWNLRAIFGGITPIPIQWLEPLSPFCREFILQHYRPSPGNANGVMIRPLLMFSRSIAEKDISDIHEQYLRVENKDANCIQTWYPPFWRRSPTIMVRTARPTLEAQRKRIDVPVDIEEPELHFDPLCPDFAAEYGNLCRWANVVRLKDWSDGDRIATVFPGNYRNPVVPKFEIGPEHALSTVAVHEFQSTQQ